MILLSAAVATATGVFDAIQCHLDACMKQLGAGVLVYRARMSTVGAVFN